MKATALALMVPAAVSACLFAIPSGWAQTTSSQSNYIFRFNTGVSGVFLGEMAFQSEQPLNLGTCTVTEKVNGPLSCVVNCQSQSVCLLELSGPSGSSVTDVLEEVSETPVTASSPTPSASAAPSSAYGSLIVAPADRASATEQRIEAYNR